jgi:hypothetical protein
MAFDDRATWLLGIEPPILPAPMDAARGDAVSGRGPRQGRREAKPRAGLATAAANVARRAARMIADHTRRAASPRTLARSSWANAIARRLRA